MRMKNYSIKRVIIIPNQTMVNYAQAKVYRLVNNVDDKEYIGSTCKELHARERYWIETLKPVLNNAIPTRSQKEYY